MFRGLKEYWNEKALKEANYTELVLPISKGSHAWFLEAIGEESF